MVSDEQFLATDDHCSQMTFSTGFPVVGGRQSDGNFVGQAQPKSRSFTLEGTKNKKGRYTPGGDEQWTHEDHEAVSLFRKKIPASSHFLFFTKKKGIAPSRNNLKTHGFRMSLFQPYPSCVRIAKGYTLQGSVCISQSGVDWLVGQGPFLGLENTSGFSAGKKHERNPVAFSLPGNFLGELVERDFAIEGTEL